MWNMNERGNILHELLNMGEAMLTHGAEVNRVETMLVDMGKAYGAASVSAFAIATHIVVTMTFPDGEELTQTRRVWRAGAPATDYRVVEVAHRLSKRCQREPLPVAELAEAVRACTRHPADRSGLYLGSVFAAAGFAVFFGGNAADALIAALFAIAVCVQQERLMPYCPNILVFNLLCSFITGLGICAVNALFEMAGADALIHLDKILIGEVMLLIPGIFMTNAIRDMLVGDMVSGMTRFVETLLWAVALAGGFMGALWLFGGEVANGPGLGSDPLSVAVYLAAAYFGSLGFAMMFHLPRPYLPVAGLGGLLTWAVYLGVGAAAPNLGDSVFFPTLLASAFGALYAEALARRRDVPSLMFLIPAVVPLIPGAGLYYTMSYAVATDWVTVGEYALRTGHFALGIAVGMCLIWAFSGIVRAALGKVQR